MNILRKIKSELCAGGSERPMQKTAYLTAYSQTDLHFIIQVRQIFIGATKQIQ